MKTLVLLTSICGLCLLFASSVFAPSLYIQHFFEKINKLSEKTKTLNSQITNLEKKGLDCSYQKTATTVAENFLQYAKEDMQHNETKRAQDAVEEIKEMLSKAERELKDISAGKIIPPMIPRYVTGPINIDGTVLIARTKTISGKKEVRPVFFNGYGHFGQVCNDIEKFPGYGINIIQIETGPWSIIPEENKYEDAAIKGLLSVADRAAKNNIQINLLLSPHYFPGWALNKYPHLNDCEKQGSIKFCIDSPDSKMVLEKYLRYLIPKVKDHPALHSICLSNEPVYVGSTRCEISKKLWREWLKKKHGDISTLNKRFNSDYKSFKDVPIPKLSVSPTPIFSDWCKFNEERFANWHKWMADIVQEMAPNVPLHSKVMLWMPFQRSTIGWGVSPELFAKFSQYNGNDAGKTFSGTGEYANSWLLQNMGYDLQCSVANKPVFNSENHIIPDRNFNYVPPIHIRNVYWQGAIHGQSATTTWVWERTYDPKHDFAGSIMHRPACSQMLGITNLDLLRLSREVSAIQCTKPEILLLYSRTSIVYSREYSDMTHRAYEALNFCGVKLGFITERQLTKGRIPKEVKIIVVAGVTNIPESSINGLKRFVKHGGKVVFTDKNLLALNEYNKNITQKIKPYKIVDLNKGKEDRVKHLSKIISKLKISRPVEVVDAETGKPVLGIEYLPAKNNVGKHIVNITNYKNISKTVNILIDGKKVQATNLFDGKKSDEFELKPLEVVLLLI